MAGSGKKAAKLLGAVTPKRAEEFLLDLANTDPINASLANADELSVDLAKQFSRRYPEIFEPLGANPQRWAEALTWVQLCLQRAWQASDNRHRQWCARGCLPR